MKLEGYMAQLEAKNAASLVELKVWQQDDVYDDPFSISVWGFADCPDRLNGLAINPDGKVVGSVKDYIDKPADAFTNKIYHNPKDAPLFNIITNPIGKATY